MSKFQERLRELKDASGKTQITIARDLGVTQQAFSYYMNGREPDYDVLIKIAEYFDVSADYLLGISDCKKLENNAIQQELGLSESAIGTLRKYSQSVNVSNCMSSSDILSQIISSDNFETVLMLLNMYLGMDQEQWAEESEALRKALIRPNLVGIAVTPHALKYFVKEQIVSLFSFIIDSLPSFPDLSPEARNEFMVNRYQKESKKAPPKQD